MFREEKLRFGNAAADPVWLAPMAGFTDSAMRTLCLEQGAGAVYSELVSAEGLRRDDVRTFFLLETTPDERPIAAHLFGADPAAMAEAARRAEATGRFDWIDINAGCPVKKVVSRGAGAALLKDLGRLGRIVEAVRKAVRLPVSVKTRIGWRPGEPPPAEIARVIEESGADLLAVHARPANRFHAGEPDWEALAEMKAALQRIPLVGNGGVDGPESARAMVRASGADGVMIGRAALGNPWIFTRFRAVLRGDPPPPPPSFRERREMVAEHLRRLVALHERKQQMLRRPAPRPPETAACVQFRTHLPHYLRGWRGKKDLLVKLPRLLTVADILAEMDRLLEKQEEAGGDEER